MPDQIAIDVRVRYSECDPQSVAHHSVFPIWMELARIELLRANGISYRQCEEQGVFFVVVALNIRYRRAARYDDLLTIDVKHIHIGRIQIEHEYRITRDDELIAEASTTLACVDRQGRPAAMPEGFLRK